MTAAQGQRAGAPQGNEERGRKTPFRFAERCLYDFHENEARLAVLRDDRRMLEQSSSVKVPHYGFEAGSGGVSDGGVSGRVERIEKLDEDIQRLERRVRPIQRLIADLEAPYVLQDSPKAELLKILRLYYFGNNMPVSVAKELYINKRTFFRRRDELVKLTIRYLGL